MDLMQASSVYRGVLMKVLTVCLMTVIGFELCSRGHAGKSNLLQLLEARSYVIENSILA